MPTLQRQPAMPDVIAEIREALMRPVLVASHRRPMTVQAAGVSARAMSQPPAGRTTEKNGA